VQLIGAETGTSPWEFGWEALVALGTFTLAAATAFLAWKTWTLATTTAREVEAAERHAQTAADAVAVSRAGLEGSVRPVLTEPLGLQGPAVDLFESDGSLIVSLFLRNVGHGIAFFRDAALGWEDGEYRWHGQARSGTLPAGEVARFEFSIPLLGESALDLPALLERGAFSIKVEYSDLVGNVWTTRADARRDAAGAWSLSGVVLEAHGKIEFVGW
jgi:hypothetical protein